MIKYTVLNNRFYSANLLTGGVDIHPKDENIIFMLTEHVDDDNYIYQTALKYVKMPKTSLCFYGRNAILWRMCCEAINRQVYPDQEQRRFQSYDKYDNWEDFVVELQNCLEVRELVLCDIIVLYDDYPLYEKLMSDSRIKAMFGNFWQK